MNFKASSILLLLVIAVLSCAADVHAASATQKLDEMKDRAPTNAGVRYQRFNSDRTPLDLLFTMNAERHDEMQARVAEMMKHTRLHAEAKRKVEEQMKDLAQKRR